MNELLLVLILLSDPGARPAADTIAQRITDQAGTQVRVVIGIDALAELKKHDVTDGDLTSQPAVGIALTGKDRKLAVIHLDREERGGNVVIQSVVWSLGHRDQHVAIAGLPKRAPKTDKPDPATDKPGKDDPLDSVGRGVIAILSPWLAVAGGSSSSEVDGRLAGLADNNDWKQIIALTDNVAKPTARQRYYRVLALVRTNHPDDAEIAFQDFKKANPTHVLLSALDEILHPVPKTPGKPAGPDINNDPAVDDGSNVLR